MTEHVPLKFNITRCDILKLQMNRKSLLAGVPPQTPLGELTTLPQTHSRLGRGKHLPHNPPLDAFGVSTSAPTAPRLLGPLTENSWLRLWSLYKFLIIKTFTVISAVKFLLTLSNNVHKIQRVHALLQKLTKTFTAKMTARTCIPPMSNRTL